MVDFDPYTDEIPSNYTFCAIHYELEYIHEDAYRICFECSHVYSTAQELVDRYNEMQARVHAWERNDNENDSLTGYPIATDAEKIFFCQYCIHDF